MASEERRHFYGSEHLNRAAERRSDAAWIEARLELATTRLVPVWECRNLLRLDPEPAAGFLRRDEVEDGELARSLPVFLGLDGDDIAWFAVLFDGDEPPALQSDEAVRFAGLRRSGPLLERKAAGMLAFARAMANWHATNRYCGACGAPTRVRDAGWLRCCTAPSCGREHFPRMDPAVIMRVTYRDRILLGRQAAWPPLWYSVLAGFVEPGESLEDAVRREVREEVGVTVTRVRYDSSQPWPFPQSLMLGFSAVAVDDAIRCDGRELEDARWFDRAQIQAARDAGTLRLSPKASISRHLIDSWLQHPDGT